MTNVEIKWDNGADVFSKMGREGEWESGRSKRSGDSATAERREGTALDKAAIKYTFAVFL